VLVTRSSAIQRGTHPHDIIPVDENHSEIVKFSEQDPTYELALSRLRELEPVSSELLVRIANTPRQWSHYGGISSVDQDRRFTKTGK
jgi:hypothetical protein